MRAPFTEVESIFDTAVYENNAWYRRDLAPGSGRWAVDGNGDPASLIFTCPCGCGVIAAAAVHLHESGTGWKWNGNRNQPTLTPSVQRTDGCKWHGYLIMGAWTSV